MNYELLGYLWSSLAGLGLRSSHFSTLETLLPLVGYHPPAHLCYCPLGMMIDCANDVDGSRPRPLAVRSRTPNCLVEPIPPGNGRQATPGSLEWCLPAFIPTCARERCNRSRSKKHGRSRFTFHVSAPPAFLLAKKVTEITETRQKLPVLRSRPELWEDQVPP